MVDLKLALRNLLRHPVRTLISFMGVSLSLALVQTYQNFTQGAYAHMVETGVRSGSGHITVYRCHFLDDRDAALSFDPGHLERDVPKIKGVAEVMGRLYFSGLAQSSRENRNIMIMGTNLQTERAVNPFLRKLPRTLFNGPWNAGDALVGSELVADLKIGLGRTFVITMQTAADDLVSELFTVKGIVHTGIREIDSTMVMLDRHSAAAMAGVEGQLHELAVVLEDREKDRDVYLKLKNMIAPREDLEVVSWERAMPNLFNALRWDYVEGKLLSYVVLLIVTIGVVNTLLMSVMERFNEFGMLRAIGTSPYRLGRMILFEALGLGLASMGAGTAICALATWYLSVYGLDLRLFLPDNLAFGGVIFSALIFARWDLVWMARSGAYIVVLCVLASLYPAIKASRVTPLAAMGHS